MSKTFSGSVVRSWRTCGTAALLFAVLALSGCSQYSSYIHICGPNDLNEEQKTQIAGQAHRHDTFDSDEGQIGVRTTWIPLIYRQHSSNDIESGPLASDTPSEYIEQNPMAQWIRARDTLTLGPLALPFYQGRTAHFELTGKNFGYRRNTLLLWGAIWLDHYAGRARSKEATHITGLLFSAFGYQRDERMEGIIRSVRFLWIPIPFSWE